MARSEPDTRRVYLAYRAVFVGPLALTSTPKAVKKVILKAENDRNDLTNDFGFDKVVAILVTLLKADVFKSELKAKHVFPDLFRTRSGRTGRLDPSEDNAARFQTALAEPTSAILRTCSRRRPAQANASEAIVAREAASLRDGAEVDHASSDQEGLVNDDVMVIDDPQAHIPEKESVKSPRSYPLYFPYIVQHTVLSNTQRLLEECCFEFTARWIPTILKEQNWTCVEALELTEWTKIMHEHRDKIPVEALFMKPGESLKVIFFGTKDIRHSAVHRLPVAAKELHHLVRSAQRLARTLGDIVRATQLDQVSTELEGQVEELKIQVNILENRLDDQLQGITVQRAELDKKESEATTAMLEEVQKKITRIGSFLEATVRPIFKLDDKHATQPAMGMNGTLDDGEEAKSRVKLDLAEPGEEQQSATAQSEIIGLTGE